MAARSGGAGGWREREEAQRAAVAAEVDAHETERVWSPMDPVLGSLPDGARVAVVTLLGSLCPITLAHVECFVAARTLLREGTAVGGGYEECVGLFGLNPDGALLHKLPKSEILCFEDRRHLVELATAHLPWLGFSPRCCMPGSGKLEASKLQARWPKLRIVHFTMNGADDVLKYEKWADHSSEERMITMLRPGCEDQLRARLHAAGLPPTGTATFVVGPTMPNVSSTQAREAAQRSDRDTLLTMLHPGVTDWMLAHHTHSGERTTRKRAQAGGSAGGQFPTPGRIVKRRCSDALQQEPSQHDHGLERAELSKGARRLVQLCPLREVSKEDQREWAVQLDKEVLRRHAGSQQEVKAHLRNLLHNLRCNGPALALYEPAELAALSPEQLAEDSREIRLREVTGRRFDHRDLEAERPWHSSYADPPPVLSGESAWRTSKQRLVFCVREIDAESRQALSHYFNQVPRVEIFSGNILTLDGVVDAFISPANTIGNMDGGIDRAYATHFGWSFGRPYESANPLQRTIDAKYGTRAELPIGEHIVAPVEPLAEAGSDASLHADRSVRFLIAAPTMATPGPISLGSRIPYQASLAAFRACRERDCESQDAPGGQCIKAVACPMFGTGWGKVPPWVAAAQMWEAFTVAWK